MSDSVGRPILVARSRDAAREPPVLKVVRSQTRPVFVVRELRASADGLLYHGDWHDSPTRPAGRDERIS